MVKKVFTFLMQLIIISCCAVIIYFTYNHYIAEDKNIAGPYDSDVRFVYGNLPVAVKESGGTNSSIIYTDDKLTIKDNVVAKNTVFGDTVTSSLNANYLNQFTTVIKSTENNERQLFPITLNERYVDVMLQSPISVFGVMSEDNYYQSVSRVKLQSTLNYDIDASVITQIKDDIRVDFLVNEKVESVNYDRAKDSFYVTYISTDDNNPLLKFSKSLKLQVYKWNEEENNYVTNGEVINTEIYPSSEGVLYSEITKENEVQVFYATEINGAEDKVYNYYRISYNVEQKKKFDLQLLGKKTVDTDKNISLINSFKIRDTIYLFFDDLRYLKVNVVDKSVKEITIIDTGAVSNVLFDTDGTNIYMMSSSDTNFILFTILDGVVTDKYVQSTRELSSIFSNHNQIHDFSVKTKPITQ